MNERAFDVFLSYSATDTKIARSVAIALRARGLEVFEAAAVPVGAPIRAAVVSAIAECKAVVAIVTADSIDSPNIAVELGAGIAWLRPVYILTSDVPASRKFAELAQVRVFELSQIDDVVFEIERASEPLSEPEREALIGLFRGVRSSVDRLVLQPQSVAALAESFARKCGKYVAGERLVHELLRLRKRGRLHKSKSA